jgi:ribosomal protein S2
VDNRTRQRVSNGTKRAATQTSSRVFESRRTPGTFTNPADALTPELTPTEITQGVTQRTRWTSVRAFCPQYDTQ